MNRDPGTQCWLRALTWDVAPPVPGDFLRTARGSCYRIEEIRGGSRPPWRLRCTRLERNAVQWGEEGVFAWGWAPRRRSPATP